MLSAVRDILLIPQVQPSFLARLTHNLFASALGSATPTFTRATVAYQTDFEGKLNAVLSGEARFQGARRVRNLLPTTSENFTNAAWIKVSGGGPAVPSVNAVPVTGPTGSANAYAVTFPTVTGAGQYSLLGSASFTPLNGAVTPSVWLRNRSGASTIFIFINNGADSHVITASVTTAWQRFSVVGSTMTTTAGRLYIGGNGTSPGNITAQTVDIAMAMVENVTGQANQNPSEYVSVGGSTPWHGAGADGVKYFNTLNGNTVASNVVTEATGAPITSAAAEAAGGVTAGVVDAYGPFGYLAEGVRTNRLLQSQTLENVAWTASNMTVDDASAVGPTGASTATTLTAAAANATIIQDLGVVASASKTGGIWIKRKTGTGNIDLTMDGGTGWTTKAVTTTWTRFEKNQTLADEDFGIRIVTDTDAIYVWNGQVETAAFLSSDIVTTTVAVARNADVLTYPMAGNFSNTVGALSVEYFSPNAGLTYGYAGDLIVPQGGGSPAKSSSQFTNMGLFDGTTYVLAGSNSASVMNKYAASWGGAGQIGSLNGAATVSGSFDGSYNGATNIQISPSSIFGTIRNATILPKAVSSAKLQTYTLPGPAPF